VLRSRPMFTVLPLFIVIFIDGMGLSLLFPVLSNLILDPSTQFVSHTMSIAMREFLYELIVSVFMFCWFFGAAILGDLSDRTGRKKILIISLLGACVGYFFAAIAIWINSIILLLIGRVIAGFTAGSQPIAQAAIVDISSDTNKAKNIGFILLASSLGFVLGPILGGILSNNQWVSWFSFEVPMYFAALISFINAIFLWCYFHETFEVTGSVKIRLHRAMSMFISAFQHEGIRFLSCVFFVFIFGWSAYFSFILIYMNQIYHLTNLTSSLFLAVMGGGY